MKTLLFVSDKDKNFNHSFIQNVINGYLGEFYNCICCYFGDEPRFTGGGVREICLNRADRKNALDIINSEFISLENVDFVIVRNFLDVLQNAIKLKKSYNFKLCFQLSFVHFYRPYHEAKLTKKSTTFKYIKYKINSFLYNKFISKCDGFFPISNLMVREFFPSIKTKTMPIPLGINTSQKITHKSQEGKMRFIYIGAVDVNRQMERFFDQVANSKSDFEFVIYTSDYEYTRSILPNDKRFSLNNAVKKDELFTIMSEFDVGCFYVPINRLYDLCSPTKVMDYYCCGLGVFTTPVNECRELFDDSCAFFMDDDITRCIDEICSTPKKQIAQMANRGFEILAKRRNYELMAGEISKFLEEL